MLTADQRKELEALEAEMRADAAAGKTLSQRGNFHQLENWADRIAAVLADEVEEG